MESGIPLTTRTQSTTNGEITIEELFPNVSSKRDSPRNSDSSSLHVVINKYLVSVSNL
jgi:hypothetical protein